MEKTYNGYTNYPTWLISSILQDDMSYWTDEAKQALNAANKDRQLEYVSLDYLFKSILSHRIQDYVHEIAESELEYKFGFVYDLFEYALEEVNWIEIAEVIIELSGIDENSVIDEDANSNEGDE